MTHEKEFKHENGNTVKVEVRLWVDYFRTNDFRYIVSVYMKEKGKRKYCQVKNPPAYIDLIHETKTELWEKLKP